MRLLPKFKDPFDPFYESKLYSWWFRLTIRFRKIGDEFHYDE